MVVDLCVLLYYDLAADEIISHVCITLFISPIELWVIFLIYNNLQRWFSTTTKFSK